MTVPIPMCTASERELAVMTAFMLPWTLLFCSGFEDFAVAARRDWVFWSGTVLLLIFVYYFDRHVASFTLTKVAMPLLATSGGALPHVTRRLRLLYTICSLVAGAIGLFFAYQLAAASVLRGSAIGMIAGLMVFFCVASIATGIFGVFSLTNAIRRWRHG